MERRANASFQNLTEYNDVISNSVVEKLYFGKLVNVCVIGHASLPAILTQDFIQGNFENEQVQPC